MFEKMNVKEIVDKIDEIKNKEKFYTTKDWKWCISLHYCKWAIIKKWNVIISYRHETVVEKAFRKYEDALRFYEQCVQEIKRRYEDV